MVLDVEEACATAKSILVAAEGADRRQCIVKVSFLPHRSSAFMHSQSVITLDNQKRITGAAKGSDSATTLFVRTSFCECSL